MRRKGVEKTEPVLVRRIHIIGAKEDERPSVMELPDYRDKLLEAVTGSKKKDESIAVLRKMHPGIRELRMKNEIARQYEVHDWERMVRKYTNAMRELYEQCGLREPTPAERLEAVRDENNLTEAQKYAFANMFKTRKSNIELAASIQLKLRKTEAEKLSLKLFDDNEKKILDRLLPGKAPLEEKATPDEFKRLKEELIEKLYIQIENKNGIKLEKKIIFPSCLALYNNGECGIESLRRAVREKKEAEILLESMGKEANHSAAFFEDRGLTCGKNQPNGDAFLSADIYEDGKTKRFDAVFDGVGQSDDASSASKTAVEVFKLGLLLKSPQSAGDIEMLATMADIAIFTSKSQKTGLCSSSTTMVAVLSNGKKTFACHAGDSRWMVFRENKLSQSSTDHSIAEDLKKNGIPCPSNLESAINSALGTGFTHLESHALKLKKGDAVLLCSDGINNTVNMDEIEKILSEDHDAGLSESRIFVLAVLRDNGKEPDVKTAYPTITGGTVFGKLDDKTIILYRIE